jgi:bifunctional non-homologous end joining protein LigD
MRFSETLEASPTDFIDVVRDQGFEGIVAKRRDSKYESGQRSGAWQKLRVLQRRDFIIGGYTPGGRNFDGVLIGVRHGKELTYVAKVHGWLTSALRDSVFKQFAGLEAKRCLFANPHETNRGQWDEGLTAKKMGEAVGSNRASSRGLSISSGQPESSPPCDVCEA